jgi:hypothetical protein
MRNANQVGKPVGGVGPTLKSQGFTNIVPLDPQSKASRTWRSTTTP